MRHVIPEAERSGDQVACSLAICLFFCLNDAEYHSTPAAKLLRAAIGQLQEQVPEGEVARRDGATDMTALTSYLQYLLPELEARSPAAANFVRQAVFALKRSMKSVAGHASVTLH